MHVYPLPFLEDRPSAIQPDLCFVIMPFTRPWSARIYKMLRELVEAEGFKCQRADDLYGRVVLTDIWRGLNRAAFVVADLTDANPNVYYELGLAHALGKEIIPLLQSHQEIPFDQKPFRVLYYEDNADGYEILHSRLPEWVRQLTFSTTPEMMLRRQSVVAFNSWRQSNVLRSLQAEDLSCLHLSGVDFHEAHLTDANLSRSDMSGANFERANLIRANLEGADLSGARLLRCNLSEARLSGTRVREADLSGVIMLRPDLSGTDLADADVKGLTIDSASHERYKSCFARCHNVGEIIVER